MTTATPRPIIRLDGPINADPPELYCPRTGALVVSNGEDEVEQPASPHVTFVYPEVDIEVPPEHTPLGEVPMVYELRTSGVACACPYHASLAGGAMTHCATLSEVSWRAFSTFSHADPVHFPCRVNPSFSA